MEEMEHRKLSVAVVGVEVHTSALVVMEHLVPLLQHLVEVALVVVVEVQMPAPYLVVLPEVTASFYSPTSSTHKHTNTLYTGSFRVKHRSMFVLRVKHRSMFVN